MKSMAKLNLKDKINSFRLSFTSEEILDSVKNANDGIASKGRLAWLQEKPSVVREMDDQLRKYFKISTDKEMIFSYYDPELNQKSDIVIHQQKDIVSDRIIFVTTDDRITFSFNGKEEEFDINGYEAYHLPQILSQMITINFSSQSVYTPAAKKGFRSVRKSRNFKNRHIMVFEYKYNKEDLDNLNQIFNKTISNKKGNDPSIDAALKTLLGK